MIGPLQILDDEALKDADAALGEFMNRSDIKFAAAVCVSAYLISLEKRNPGDGKPE